MDKLLFVLLGIVILVFLSSFKINIIEPLDNFTSLDNKIEFRWNGLVNRIFIDDNKEFTSPIIEKVKDGKFSIDLEPGNYYWRLKGLTKSDIRTFNIVSNVGLEVKREGNESYDVENVGNTNLDVEVRENSMLVGFTVLDVNQSKEYKILENTTFIGKKK